jgi:hypothetical protein
MYFNVQTKMHFSLNFEADGKIRRELTVKLDLTEKIK